MINYEMETQLPPCFCKLSWTQQILEFSKNDIWLGFVTENVLYCSTLLNLSSLYIVLPICLNT